MDRIIEVVEILNRVLDKYESNTASASKDELLEEMLHVYGTAYFSAAIASVRGLDPKLAFVIGLMHDTGRFAGNMDDGKHGPVGAVKVKKLLGDMKRFTDEELEIISCAIHNHSNKKDIGTEYEEIIKDADVLERLFLAKETYVGNKKRRKRLKNALEQLGLKLFQKKKKT